MGGSLIAIVRALASSEAMKLRRTPAIWLVLASPGAVIAILFIALLNRTFPPPGSTAEMWRSLLHGAWTWWLAFLSSIPWTEILNTAGKGYVACWLVIVIQTWLSTRFRGTAVSVGIGFAALAVGFALAVIFGRSGDNVYACYPWLSGFRTLPGGRYDVHNPIFPAVFGGVGGVLAGAWACWDLARRREVE